MIARRTLAQRLAKASLGLALALQLCPMAALASEGDAVAEDEAAAVEEVLVEEEPEEVAEPGEEAEAVDEEAAVQEEPAVTEEAPDESTTVEDGAEAAEEPEEPELTAQATTGDLYFGKYYTEDGSYSEYDEETGSYRYYDYQVRVYNVTAGDVLYDEANKTLIISNATIEGEIRSYVDLTIMLTGNSTAQRFSCGSIALTFTGSGSLTVGDSYSFYTKSLTMLGGNVTLKGYFDCDGALSVSGGTLTSSRDLNCDSFSMTGGSVKGRVYCQNNDDSGNASISGGTLNGRVSCKAFKLSGSGKIAYTGDSNDYYSAVSCSSFDMSSGSITATNAGVSAGDNFTMSGGTITTSGKYGGVGANGNFTMNGGTIKAVNCDGYAIEVGSYTDGKSYAMNIKNGTIVITNPSERGIYIVFGNLSISGGTVSVTGSYGSGIYVYSNTYRGTTYGGKVSITGGSVTATTRKPKSSSAIYADYMTNKPACLKTIAGRLPKGATFKTGGNTYQVYDYSDAVLASYGSKKTTATFDKVRFGSYAYTIKGVGANAFNTAQGKKVKSITFKDSIYYLGKNAFKNTKSLTSFKGWFLVDESVKYRGGKTIWIMKKSSYSHYAKGSLAGMGKNNGRGLTLKVGGSKEYNVGLRKYLRKLGLPAGVKFGIRR